MSVRTLAAVADLKATTPTCKLVLFAMAINADQHDTTSMSYADLCRVTCLSERAIRNAVRTLERRKHLAIVPAAAASRTNFSYQLTL